jgi:hypothetical protein
MLLLIREFLRRERVASNQQIARELQIDIHTLQPMLDLWLHKDVIKRCQDTSHCQSRCFKCSNQPPVYYQYCDTKK